jgi:hypothetical protein
MDPPGTQPPNAGAQQQGTRPTNKRLQQTQAQVDEVVGIMKVQTYLFNNQNHT